MTLPHKLTLSHIYSEMQSSVLILQEKNPLLYKQPTLTFSVESKISCFFFFSLSLSLCRWELLMVKKYSSRDCLSTLYFAQ